MSAINRAGHGRTNKGRDEWRRGKMGDGAKAYQLIIDEFVHAVNAALLDDTIFLQQMCHAAPSANRSDAGNKLTGSTSQVSAMGSLKLFQSMV
jgi:hypothetical protein